MKIYELLEKPESWCQNTYAMNKDGHSLMWYNCPDACKWCLMGAIFKLYDPHESDKIMDKVKSKLSTNTLTSYGYNLSSIAKWNDDPDRTHAEVLALTKELDI